MGLDPSLVEEIRVGALLHELGKGRGVLFSGEILDALFASLKA